jgi:hypothetical protein
MPWFKVDDSYYDHPKVFDAPDCAVTLWVRAGCWSARNLTDGLVPTGMPARLCDDHDTAVRELLHRGLWERASGGYRFHDWAEYQPSAEDVLGVRAKRAAAGRLGGLAKSAKQKASNGLANAKQLAKQTAAPTRPDPTRKNKPSSSASPTDDDPDWATFWAAYPRKKGKGQARKAWGKAVKTTDPASIIAGATRYAEERRGQDQQYTAHPATWLNGERWTDQTAPLPAEQRPVWWDH